MNAYPKLNKNCYSYQDCWNYAFSLRKAIEIEKVKNDLITLCRTVPEHFWLTFSNKSLSLLDYSKTCRNLTKYINENYPVPYLTRQVFFYGLSFSIKKGIFIPQKDTEILVEKTLELADKIWERTEQLKVLDIGTGCGNVAISLAKNKPRWNFTAIDINKRALKVAKTNATFYQLKNIEFVRSDLFDNIREREKFDIVVANPPYVSDSEYSDIFSAVREQPKEALVAKNSGYFFYQEILTKVRAFLRKRFLLMLEIGHQQKRKVIKLIIEHFPRAKVSIFPDWEDHSRTVAIFQL